MHITVGSPISLAHEGIEDHPVLWYFAIIIHLVDFDVFFLFCCCGLCARCLLSQVPCAQTVFFGGLLVQKWATPRIFAYFRGVASTLLSATVFFKTRSFSYHRFRGYLRKELMVIFCNEPCGSSTTEKCRRKMLPAVIIFGWAFTRPGRMTPQKNFWGVSQDGVP